MLDYFRDFFKYDEILEQKKSGTWKKVRKYKNKTKFLALFGGLIIFFASLMLPLPQPQMQEEVLPVEENVNVIDDDLVSFTFTGGVANSLGYQNEIWGQIKKETGRFAVYEKMEEGNKELGEWDVFIPDDLPVGEVDVRLPVSVKMKSADISEFEKIAAPNMKIIIID